ncbi:hypothetical protein LLH23_11305 [bacterium]|nr:hypothetical protein [bacterium]
MHSRHPLLIALMALLLGSGAGHAGFRNTDNTRFATRANGPMGPIVIPHRSGVTNPAGTQGLLTYRQHNPNLLHRAAVTYSHIQDLNLTKHKGEVRFPRTLVHTLDGKLVQTDLAKRQSASYTSSKSSRLRGRRSARSLWATGATVSTAAIGDPANNLTFQFEGWTSAEQASLQSYLTTAYAKAKSIYGPPAFSNTVKIIQDTTISDIQGGVYDTSANEIRLPALTDNFAEDTYVLLMLVLNAFHDDAIFYYDAWEQGFIGAAAYVIQTTPGVSPGYDPIDPGPFYCLSVYEAENQEQLGNNTFYPASGATNMLAWRIAMARAAWLKCYIENEDFFKDFNTAYYAAYTSDLAGDIPSLKEIAASVVPTVEGTPFVEWYEQQYVLDTSVQVGKKLYTWNVPLEDSVALICELYQTSGAGDETPLGGTAATVYWDYTNGVELYAEEGNAIAISSSGATPGEGYLIPTFYNVGGAQRITVQIDVEGLRGEYAYPYAKRGFDSSSNNLYGAIVGDGTGSVDVTGGDGLAGVSVNRGVWGSRITSTDLSPMQVEITFTNEAGQSVTAIRNIGWDSYMCLLQSGSHATASHTFAYDVNGLYLMSLPLKPLSSDLTQVLGVPLEKLLLAWWNPLLAGDNKWELWPQFEFHSPGQGYWWRVPADTTVNLEGLQPDTAQTFEMDVKAGWNLVGCPRLSIVTLDSLQVRQGANDPVTWDAAVAAHLVQDGIYAYDQTVGYQLAEACQPWEAYWLRCLVSDGVTLIFPAVTE